MFNTRAAGDILSESRLDDLTNGSETAGYLVRYGHKSVYITIRRHLRMESQYMFGNWTRRMGSCRQRSGNRFLGGPLDEWLVHGIRYIQSPVRFIMRRHEPQWRREFAHLEEFFS